MTALSIERLIEIVGQSTTTITISESDGPEWMRTSETVEVIDAKEFQKALQALLDGRHSVVFADLVGTPLQGLAAFLNARSPYEKSLHPINFIEFPDMGSRAVMHENGYQWIAITDSSEIVAGIGLRLRIDTPTNEIVQIIDHPIS
jgi:hypothetical protein